MYMMYIVTTPRSHYAGALWKRHIFAIDNLSTVSERKRSTWRRRRRRVNSGTVFILLHFSVFVLLPFITFLYWVFVFII
jgi:hypothetical protein